MRNWRGDPKAQRPSGILNPERRRHVRRFGAIAACSLLVTTLTITTLGVVWARELREPRITLLGAGDQLSVLVSAGAARVLFVAGDDPVAFAAALNRARFPTTRRIDVVFVGEASEEMTPRIETLVTSARAVGYFNDSGAGQVPIASSLAEVAPMRTPRRIRLTTDLTITIESVPASPTEQVDVATAWRATIVHRETTVVLVSDGHAATMIPNGARLSAVIVAGNAPRDALRQTETPLLAFSAESLSGKELRQLAAASPTRASWAMRVFPGEAVRLELTRSGLRFDERDAQPLSAELEAATPDPKP